MKKSKFYWNKYVNKSLKEYEKTIIKSKMLTNTCPNIETLITANNFIIPLQMLL